jgi:tetratricopeptide (TPR) repeat protein
MTYARLLGFLAVAASLAAQVGCASSLEKQRELRQKEESADELYKKGKAAAAAGDMTRAEQYLVSALRAGGPEKRLVQSLLFVCVADQRYPVALEHAEHYLHRHPQDTEVQFAAASLHAAIGDFQGAQQRLQTIVQAQPNWAEAHYALATVLREEGDQLSLADEQDLAYLRLNPTGPYAETARSRLSGAVK